MAAHAIHQQAAEAKMHPREWLLQALHESGSQHKLAARLSVAQNVIVRAMCEYRIMELRFYRFKDYRAIVVREWLREEELLRRSDWQEIRVNRLPGEVRD